MFSVVTEYRERAINWLYTGEKSFRLILMDEKLFIERKVKKNSFRKKTNT